MENIIVGLVFLFYVAGGAAVLLFVLSCLGMFGEYIIEAVTGEEYKKDNPIATLGLGAGIVVVLLLVLYFVGSAVRLL